MVENFVFRFINELREPMDIYASLRPLLLVCFVSGIAPLRAVGNPGNRHLVLTIFGYAFTLIHVVWFCASYTRNISDESLQTHLLRSKFSHFGENTRVNIACMAPGFTLILYFLKRNKLRDLLNRLTQVDKKLTRLGAKIDYRNMLKIVWIVLATQWTILFGIIGIIPLLSCSINNAPDFIEFVFLFMPIAIVITHESKYYCIMRLIKSRFIYINIVLKNLRLNADRKQIHGIFRGKVRNDIFVDRCGTITSNAEGLSVNLLRKPCVFISELCQTHEELCDACTLAKEYFGHQMLVMVAIVFVLTLLNVYFMVDVAINSMSEPDQTEFYFSSMVFGVSTMLPLIGLLRSTASITKEVSLD